VLTRSGDGWALAPTSISFAGGNATVSGRSGSAPEVHAQLRAMPLDVLDLFWPNLNLSGSATGRLDYAWKSNRSGRLDLKVHGLSRAGLVLASKPIDVAIAALVSGNQAGLRAVAASDGAIVGRAQARFAPLGSGPLVAANSACAACDISVETFGWVTSIPISTASRSPGRTKTPTPQLR